MLYLNVKYRSLGPSALGPAACLSALPSGPYRRSVRQQLTNIGKHENVNFDTKYKTVSNQIQICLN